MTLLAQVHARPRSSVRRPAYPTMVSVAALVVTACAGAAPAETPVTAEASSEPATVQVVVRATASTREAKGLDGLVEETPTEYDLVMDAPATFPEDTAEPPMVGCGGGCPPAYVLSTQAKDRMQIAARGRYCMKAGRNLWPGKHGAIGITAKIDLQGRAQDVEVDGEEGDEIPPAIRDCIERLVASAPFDHDPAFERTTNEQVEVEP